MSDSLQWSSPLSRTSQWSDSSWYCMGTLRQGPWEWVQSQINHASTDNTIHAYLNITVGTTVLILQFLCTLLAFLFLLLHFPLDLCCDIRSLKWGRKVKKSKPWETIFQGYQCCISLIKSVCTPTIKSGKGISSFTASDTKGTLEQKIHLLLYSPLWQPPSWHPHSSVARHRFHRKTGAPPPVHAACHRTHL